MPVRALPLWKRILFAALTVCALFAIAETVLLLLGVQPVVVGEDPLVGFTQVLPLFVPAENSSATPERITAPNKRELFNLQRFAQPKPAGAYRIFCLGGSTTYGHPYDDRTSFAGWLRRLLPCIDPSRKWEVINAGGISYASYREAALLEELIHYEPDLFIVFTGHNEFLEERSYGDLRALPPSLRNATGALSHCRTYTVLQRLIRPRLPKPKQTLLPAEVDALLDHSVGPSAYHRDERLRGQIVEHFEFNLRRMAHLARSVGACVVYVTPVSNLKDCSPFKSEHREAMTALERARWSTAFQQGRTLQLAGSYQAGLKAFEECLAMDERYAEVHFRRGQCLFELGRHDDARAAFARACDEDICPLRATTEIVAAVHRAATAEKSALIDFQRDLDAECFRRYGHTIAGRELFLDHVHPTIEVNGMVAMAVMSELTRLGIVHHEPTAGDCAASIAPRILAEVKPRDHATAYRMIAKVLSWAGKIEEAGPAALAALAVVPKDRESLFIAGAYFKSIGRVREGDEHFRQALEMEVAENPLDVEARQFLAKTLWALGDREAAMQHVQEALKLRPDSVEASRLLQQLQSAQQPETASNP